MKYLHRRIFKSQITGSTTIRELMQTMFVGELLQGGNPIWIVSPWISNVVVIDNRAGNFDSLNPEWGRREVRFADVLVSLMARGSLVNVVTRDQESNKGFLSSLNELTERHALEKYLAIRIHEALHTKGILLSRCLLMGSMNLTYNGLVINDESIEFSVDPADVANSRLEFRRYEDIQ
jgi:hypothetical protein